MHIVWERESVLKARHFLFVNLYSMAHENFSSYEKTMSVIMELLALFRNELSNLFFQSGHVKG